MVEYQFVQIRDTDVAFEGMAAEGSRIQSEHLRYFEQLSHDGRALAFGRIHDRGKLRAAVILDAGSVESAEMLMAGAPWIQRGTLRAEVHPWWAAKGILQKPPLFRDTEPTVLGLLERPDDAPEFSDEKLAGISRRARCHRSKVTVSPVSTV